MLPDTVLIQLLSELGVRYPQDIENVLHSRTQVEMKTKLEQLRKRVHQNYRRWAFELHPDRTGEDSARTAHFRCLTEVKEVLDRWEPEVSSTTISFRWINPQPAPIQSRVPPRSGISFQTSYTTRNPNRDQPIQVVILKPDF